MWWKFILVLWVLLEVPAEAEVTTATVPTSGTKPVTSSVRESTLTEEKTTILNTVVSKNKDKDTEREISELVGISHGVKSGKILIIGNNGFRIQNFSFDGKAPQAYFVVGTGETISEKGTNVSLPGGSNDPLPKYQNQDVQLILPNNLTVDNIDWLAIWCYKFNIDLGHVFIHKKLSPYPPQTYFFRKEVTSGPIVLVNKKTLFIPDLRYKGDHSDVHFWVGNGSEPTSAGLEVANEKGSLESLAGYQGQNVYITLPDGVTTDNVDYFGLWSKEEELDLAHVALKGIEGVPEVSSTSRQSNADIMRLPKCCEAYWIITEIGCDYRSKEFKPDFKIYDHNETHFNNESLSVDMFIFEPYSFIPDCNAGKYYLNDADEFAILKNGSLLVKGVITSGILSQQYFCVDNIEDDPTMKIFLCAPEPKMQQAMFVAYVTLTIVSMFCFAGTFFLYCFWLKIEDVHRKCFTAYVLAMSISFFSLIIVQIGHVEGGGCEFFGFLFQFAMMASFTLLAILCFDILMIVIYIAEDMKKRKRKYYYSSIAVGVPVFFLIISLTRNLTPDVPNSFFKPQYGQNSCYFEGDNQRTALFYIPVTMSLCVACVCLAITKLKIVNYDRSLTSNYWWIERGTTYKFMWRKHFIVYLIALIWYVQSYINSNASASLLAAISLVEASQGIFVLLLFVVNKETRKIIKKTIKARKKKTNQNNIVNGREQENMLNAVTS